jgi:hypothetical protein
MKKTILGCMLMLSAALIYAQQPGGMGGPGGGGMGGPGGRGRSPGGMSQQRPNADNKVWIERLPEIPGITLEQKLELGNILTKEHQAVEAQMKKKMEIFRDSGNPEMLSPKQREKQQKKIEKIDKKIQSINQKYNKKVRKILSEEQYRVYLERKSEARFRQSPFGDGQDRERGGDRPPMRGGNPPQRPN